MAWMMFCISIFGLFVCALLSGFYGVAADFEHSAKLVNESTHFLNGVAFFLVLMIFSTIGVVIEE